MYDSYAIGSLSDAYDQGSDYSHDTSSYCTMYDSYDIGSLSDAYDQGSDYSRDSSSYCTMYDSYDIGRVRLRYDMYVSDLNVIKFTLCYNAATDLRPAAPPCP